MNIVLLTGSTGFVGSQLLRVLQQRGYQIRIVIREGSQSKVVNIDGIESVVTTFDLFSESSLWWEEVCKGVDSVIHCAWYAEPGKYLESDKNIDCLRGTLALAQGAVNAGIKRFVGIGTCFEYELSNTPLTIETPLRPLSPYAAAKAACFVFLSEFLSSKKISFLWCRLFYLFGENEDTRRLIPFVRNKILNNQIVELTSGNQIRDFMDVNDAAKQIIDLFESSLVGGANICSGKGVSVRELAEKIADQFGRRELLKFGVRQDNLIDPPYVVGIKTQNRK